MASALRILITLLTVLADGSLANAATLPAPLAVPAGAERIAAWHALRIVVAAPPTIAPAAAAGLAASAQAKRLEHAAPTFGRGRLPVWARFALSNPEAAAQQRVLTLEATTQHDVRLFRQGHDDNWQEIPRLGAGFGSGYAYPTWQLDLAGGARSDLLLRRCSSACCSPNWSGRPGSPVCSTNFFPAPRRRC